MNTAKLNNKIKKIVLSYKELLQLRQQNDPDHCINNTPFEDLKKDIEKLKNKTEISQKRKAILEQKISSLQAYLREFATFDRLQNKRAQLTHNLPKETLHKSINYIAMDRYAAQLTEDFGAANYLRSGIAPSIQRFKFHFEKFIDKHFKNTTHLKNKKSNILNEVLEKSLFEKITHKDNYENVFTYVQHNFSDTLELPASKVLQLKRGYHLHHQKVVEDEILGKKNKLKEPLDLLKKAFMTGNNAQYQKAILSLQRTIKSINIQTPNNYASVRHKLLNILGTTEPNSAINLIVNNSRNFEAMATNAGEFKFEDIELRTGENLLIFFNQKYALIDDRQYHLHISLSLDYPFMGLYDPLTQKAFATNEIDMIVRCQTCGNFMYDFSVEDNDDDCTFPKCNGRKFAGHQQPAFWSNR